MLKGKAKRTIDSLLRTQIEGEMRDHRIEYEMFRLVTDATKETARLARSYVDKGTSTPRILTDLTSTLALYLDYLAGDFGIDERDNFRRANLELLRSEQASFTYFFKKVYRKKPRYIPIW